jgi:hypothetical protein
MKSDSLLLHMEDEQMLIHWSMYDHKIIFCWNQWAILFPPDYQYVCTFWHPRIYEEYQTGVGFVC